MGANKPQSISSDNGTQRLTGERVRFVSALTALFLTVTVSLATESPEACILFAAVLFI
jgi:hypothetical protein